MQSLLKASLFLILGAAACNAQESASPWEGEWGAFDNPTATIGERLTISECTAKDCRFSLTVQDVPDHCGVLNNSTLRLQSQDVAIAQLPTDKPGQVCTLNLQRKEASGIANVRVTSEGEACISYYCTRSTVTFNHDFPQRSKVIYAGPHSNQCFLDNAPARMATCLDPTLAALEQKWQELYAEYPLDSNVANDPSPYHHAIEMDSSIVQQCNMDASPANCLRTRFNTDLAAMDVMQEAFVRGYTDLGNVADATRRAHAIAGTYQHSFPNGDVQGNHFRSTNTLRIVQSSANSIHFKTQLEFFNGHLCSLSGKASYRSDGSFVFDDEPSNSGDSEQVCRLAIIPTTTGIKFSDLTGGCHTYCGMRGGWNGQGFLFAERVQMHSSK